MRNRFVVPANSREPIYTLAQSGTGQIESAAFRGVFVNGKGTELSNRKRLQNWAKKKLISQTTMLSLVDIAKSKGDLDRAQSYWNTYHCFNRIYSAKNSLFGKYCKNRFCPLCCGIRKAEILNKYLPTLKSWASPFFLTLTVKATSARQLEKRISEMFALIQRIISKQKKRNQRGQGIRLIGIKSFECNFNPLQKTYNPHFHLILHDLHTADLIMTEWVREGRKLWGANHISKAAQLNQRVRDLEDCLVEILKYSSKIFTEPDLDKKRNGSALICLAAYDNIISAMKKHRIFDRFGFNLPEAAKPEKKLNFIRQYKEWFYDAAFSDWVEIEGELVLSGYIPTPMLSSILESQIDFKLE